LLPCVCEFEDLLVVVIIAVVEEFHAGLPAVEVEDLETQREMSEWMVRRADALGWGLP